MRNITIVWKTCTLAGLADLCKTKRECTCTHITRVLQNKQVMRIKEMITKDKISRCLNKFSQLIPLEISTEH